MVAFSFTLVAFEWRTTGAPRQVAQGLFLEEDDRDREELPRVVVREVLEQKQAATTAKKDPDRFVIAEPVTPVEPVAPVAPTGPVGPTVVDLTALLATDSAEAAPVEKKFRPGAEVMPYFMDCLLSKPTAFQQCTQERILDHMRRRFKVPRNVREDIRTTITFEVDDTGAIARIHCAPRVDRSVEAEVERVLRDLPALMPASQGGIPVGVYYQIPLRVAVR